MPLMDDQGCSGISHTWADEVLGLHFLHAGVDEVCKRSPELVQKAQHGQEWAASGGKVTGMESESNGRLSVEEKCKKIEEADMSSEKKVTLSPAQDPKSMFNFPDHIPPLPYPPKRRKRVPERRASNI